jgi:hypothetical protein
LKAGPGKATAAPRTGCGTHTSAFAEIYQIAENRCTCVEMIEKFHAAHLKTTLDVSTVNVRKPKRSGRGQSIDIITDKQAKAQAQTKRWAKRARTTDKIPL